MQRFSIGSPAAAARLGATARPGDDWPKARPCGPRKCGGDAPCHLAGCWRRPAGYPGGQAPPPPPKPAPIYTPVFEIFAAFALFFGIAALVYMLMFMALR